MREIQNRLFIFIIILLPIVVTAQPADLKFQNFNDDPLLEHMFPQKIIRDKSGYIWYGGNGILRFDGFRVKLYSKNDNGPHALRAAYIGDLALDKNGTLWIGTYGGLCYYDQAIDGFVYLDRAGKDSINYAFAFAYDGNNTLWFSTNAGLCKIDINTKKISSTSLKNYSMPNCALIDSKGKIWTGTRFDGLILYDPQNDRYKKYFFYTPDKEITGISALFEDSNNKIWVAKRRGVVKIDPDKLNSATGNVLYEEMNELKNIYVNNWTTLPSFTPDNILWIATDSGLVTLNTASEKITGSYQVDKTNPHAILSNTVTSVFTDSEKHLWVSTTKGISMLNPNTQNFKSRIIPQLENASDPYLISMVQDKADSNILWIGTSREGLLKYDRLQKKVLKQVKNVPLLKADNVNAIADDGKGSLWLGSRNALIQYIKRSGTFIKHAALPVEKYFKYRTAINKIIFSGADTLIIASSTGICSYAVKPRHYEILYTNFKNNADYNSSVIRSIKLDEGGILWGASLKGLVRIDIHTKKSILYAVVTNMPLGVLNNNNDLIIEGKNIVLATYGGIVVFNKLTSKFNLLRAEGADAFTECYSIVADSAHNYWITTESGLAMYDKRRQKFKLFTSMDGLEQNASVAPLNIINNEIICSYTSSFTAINPYTVLSNNNIPQPIISAFKIFEKPQLFDGSDENKIYDLSYEQNFISFDFNAFEYNYPDKITYAYRLKGFEEDWLYSGNKSTATYTNLAPGKYAFEMKAANSEGLWSKPAVFRINIKPAFWQTGWFKILISILFALLIYGLVKRRILKIKKEAAIRSDVAKREAELEMKALRSQMNPHFIFNSLNSIQKFIWANKQEDASEYLTKFSMLMRMILEHSMQKLITLEQELAMLRLYIELEHRRSNNKYDYTIQTDDKTDPATTLVPPMIFQPFIENAIWHGLLHKEGRGRLTVKIMAEENEMLKCIIEDDGIGRSASAAVKDKNILPHRSYGMKITEERLALMEKTDRQGSVTAADIFDAEGKAAGTRITIEIPVTTFTKI